ncbi:hypothetical protein J0910_02060 [Nocardiopsis sp. CNT-189]|uniref:hypothetical protein n=1 Tax=Nocardiopsis oceanisediminis TaxID=2816862 RepID=UPI003B2CBB49
MPHDGGFIHQFVAEVEERARERTALARMTRAERDAHLGTLFADHLGPPRPPSILTLHQDDQRHRPTTDTKEDQ